jgi:hypothetical protein
MILVVQFKECGEKRCKKTKVNSENKGEDGKERK